MHTLLHAAGPKWSRKLEGAYFPQEDLRRHNIADRPIPWLGTDGHFARETPGSDWVIQRWILREKGIAIAGPPLKPMIDPIRMGYNRAIPLLETQMPDTATLPPRSEVPLEQTWALESIFATPADWDAASKTLSDLLPTLTAYHGRLKEGAQVLLEAIQKLEETGILYGKILTYAFDAYAVDTGNQAAAARLGQSRSLEARYAAAIAFFNPELIAIGFEALRQWMQETPELAFLAHYVDQLERAQTHVRSAEVEEVLALTSDPFTGPMSTYSSLNNADLTFQPATASDGARLEVGQASIGGLLTHPDQQVRRTAWEHYADGYLAHKNTLAATLTAAVKQNVFTMRTRRYASSLHASLEASYIPVEVFHNLIAVFKKNLPTWHRYWRLRRKALGLETLGVYDIKAPLTTAKPYIPFAQAVEWICAGMAPLGEEYVRTLRRGCLEERWVDWARNRGKREGAFSSGSLGTRPFIMMSYADDQFSLSTLAHELGHSMHSYYSRSNQRFLYSNYSLFVAEVASNFNQATVRDYLLRTQPAPDFQLALLEEAMSNYHRYFFIMPTLARFELEVHSRAEKGAPLSADILIGILADLFKEGYGDEVAFDRERIGITWAQFGHMYMNFYVYQYATGISGAHALSHAVTSGEPGAADRYLGFLKSGGACYPLDALKLAGVDLTAPAPVEAAFQVLADYVDRLEKLVG
jgi:oligoendopeptidase F